MRRPSWKLLLTLVLVGLLVGQQWAYVHLAPALVGRGDWKAPGERLLLVQGPTLDEEEEASCRRDLAYASRVLASPRVRCVAPEGVWDSLRAVTPTDDVVLFLSGHGGGFNFGGGAYSLTRDALAEGLSTLHCRSLLVVLDCCWAGEFQRSFATRHFVSPCWLVTSTDATHMAPFPTSFLAPRSFGQEFFARYQGDAPAAVAATNGARRKWSWLYPKTIGLEGQVYETQH